ncbi:MAG TPA: hypothetical protein VKR61_09595 [Bryobacteraceae bacterium]|nr:hypothetical protein [Bryobacteraceae bacterium]
MNLDDELKSALRRHEPPPDFTARVLARVSAGPARTAPLAGLSSTLTRKSTRWVAAIAATLLLAAGALEYRQYEGERAKSQVLLAMRITASKLNKAQKKVQMLSHRSIS